MTAMGSPRARETARALQEAIVSGRWPINSQIPTEAALATEFGVGRSTIREAVRSLAHLGMLEPAAGRGTFVRSLSPVHGVVADFAAQHSWSDILAVRSALEVRAAATVATGRDPSRLARLAAAHGNSSGEHGQPGDCGDAARTPGQFHATLVELASNQLLADLYTALMAALRDGLRSGAIAHGLGPEERRADHTALLAAITAGNATAAAALAAAHCAGDLVVSTIEG